MKTRYQYIHFTQIIVPGKFKTSRWACRNNKSGSELGLVKWDVQWRQYIYEPDLFAQAVYSAGCLRDIAVFIDKLKENKDGEA